MTDFSSTVGTDSIYFLAGISLIGLVVMSFKGRSYSCGLMLIYLCNFSGNFLISGIVNRYHAESDPISTRGFELACIGLVGLGVGALLGRYAFSIRGPERRQSTLFLNSKVLIVMGLGIILFSPIVRWVPSLGAVLSVGENVLWFGCCLFIHQAKNRRETFNAILLSAALGLVYVMYVMLTSGFLGFGLIGYLIVICFIGATKVRPVKGVLIGGAVLYVGLSLCLTYLGGRQEIRNAVWGGESIGTRASSLITTFEQFRFFDLQNDEHLERLNMRMNQNLLLGHARDRFERGEVSYAKGKTYFHGILGLIPRVLWPNKTVEAGGGTMVSDFTGLVFAEGTSVGGDLLFEFYVNFGFIGISVGAIFLGFGLQYADLFGGRCMGLGQTRGFLLMFLCALPLTASLSNSVEVAQSFGAGVVLYFGLCWWVRQLPPGSKFLSQSGLTRGESRRFRPSRSRPNV